MYTTWQSAVQSVWYLVWKTKLGKGTGCIKVLFPHPRIFSICGKWKTKQKKTRKSSSITNGNPKYCIMTLFHMHNFPWWLRKILENRYYAHKESVSLAEQMQSSPYVEQPSLNVSSAIQSNSTNTKLIIFLPRVLIHFHASCFV